ncbi:hypothetical protein [Tropicimonas marinistellae]|uniref:hypothetical protein n=1 Tax=Tropicimonas marinistellae TaxID=1739787 RepID=UPI00082B53BF|nr:hypothetical protein [Tropicimonas marinistellae]
MQTGIEKRVTGTVTDRLVRRHPSPMSLVFRPAGEHALAHGWPVLRPGAPAPTLAHTETWRERFVFVSDDETVEVAASGFNPVLGLHFMAPWALVFGRPPAGGDAKDHGADTGGAPPDRLRH